MTDPGVLVIADYPLIFTIDRRNDCRLRYSPTSGLSPKQAAEWLAEAAGRLLEAIERS